MNQQQGDTLPLPSRHELHPDGDGRFSVRLLHSDGRSEEVVTGYTLFEAQQAMQRGDAYQKQLRRRTARAKGHA